MKTHLFETRTRLAGGEFGQNAFACNRFLRYRTRMRDFRQNTPLFMDGFGGVRCLPASTPSGFTLIELLVVLLLMLLLTTLYWGRMLPSTRERQTKACQNNLLKIHVAMEIYANDHGGVYPSATGARTAEEALDVLVPRYTIDTTIFICPGTKDSPLTAGKPLRQGKISYAYYMGLRSADAPAVLMTDRQIDSQSKTAGQIAFSTTGKPPGNNHQEYGGNLLFCDGRVESTSASVPVALPLTPGVVLLNPRP